MGTTDDSSKTAKDFNTAKLVRDPFDTGLKLSSVCHVDLDWKNGCGRKIASQGIDRRSGMRKVYVEKRKT